MLVKLTDSIGATSDQAHGLTRTVRQSLEKIRDELVVTYKIIDKAGGMAKESAHRAKAAVSQLNVTMMEEGSETEAARGRINSRGLAIQTDVNTATHPTQLH